MRVKNNTEEWVDEETFEAIRVTDKNYKCFKRTRTCKLQKVQKSSKKNKKKEKKELHKRKAY